MSEVNEVRLDTVEVRLSEDEVQMAVREYARRAVQIKGLTMYAGHAFAMKDSYDGYCVWIIRGVEA